jgi:hypothetical protein
VFWRSTPQTPLLTVSLGHQPSYRTCAHRRHSLERLCHGGLLRDAFFFSGGFYLSFTIVMETGTLIFLSLSGIGDGVSKNVLQGFWAVSVISVCIPKFSPASIHGRHVTAGYLL